jgi:hypothetical protein
LAGCSGSNGSKYVDQSILSFKTNGSKWKGLRFISGCRHLLAPDGKGDSMKIRIRFAALFVILLAVSTLGLAQEVRTDYDHNADFSKYKTYSWAKVETSNSIWDSRVKEDIDKEMQAKGLTNVPSGGDISLVAIGTTKEKPQLETYYDGGFGGWGWRGGGGMSTTTVQNYKEGTLVVDMFDTNTKKLLWRASAEDTLSDKTDKNIKKLEKSAEKMFKDFPPKSKG